MGLFDFLRNEQGRRTARAGRRVRTRPALEELEPRNLMAVTTGLAGGALTILGDAQREIIQVSFDAPDAQLVVADAQGEVERFASASIQSIAISTGDGGIITVDNAVTQPTVVHAGAGDELIRTGGGPTTVYGGSGPDKIIAGSGPATLIGGSGTNTFYSGSASIRWWAAPARTCFSR